MELILLCSTYYSIYLLTTILSAAQTINTFGDSLNQRYSRNYDMNIEEILFFKSTLTLHRLIYHDTLSMPTKIMCGILRSLNHRPTWIAAKWTYMIYGTSWGSPSISIDEFAHLLSMHILEHCILFYFICNTFAWIDDNNPDDHQHNDLHLQVFSFTRQQIIYVYQSMHCFLNNWQNYDYYISTLKRFTNNEDSLKKYRKRLPNGEIVLEELPKCSQLQPSLLYNEIWYEVLLLIEEKSAILSLNYWNKVNMQIRIHHQ